MSSRDTRALTSGVIRRGRAIAWARVGEAIAGDPRTRGVHVVYSASVVLDHDRPRARDVNPSYDVGADAIDEPGPEVDPC